MTPSDNAPAILVQDLAKSYGDVHALRGVDFSVPRGTVLGVLGPNGAGKTTAVRVLTTLTPPTSGRAFVEGHDVVKQAATVRRLIGLAGQSTAVQEELTGRQNLEIFGQLYHLGKAAPRRAQELLERFELADAADRSVKTYSGGMRRRLDLAGSLVAQPAVLFLDEPTTGLDPRSRIGMWDIIRELVADGTTLLLTTQYLDEADNLADEIIVIDHGKVIAAGTARQLKNRIGGDVLEFAVPDRGQLDAAASAVTGLTAHDPQLDRENGRVSVGVGDEGSRALIEAVRRLDAAGIDTDGLALRRPSLDDVFLALTGHAAENDTAQTPAQGKARGKKASRRRGGQKTDSQDAQSPDTGRGDTGRGDTDRSDTDRSDTEMKELT